MDQIGSKFENFNKEAAKIGFIRDLAGKTGLPPAAFIVAPILVSIIAIALDIGSSFFSTLIGVAYPTFKSILALETHTKEDDQ